MSKARMPRLRREIGSSGTSSSVQLSGSSSLTALVASLHESDSKRSELSSRSPAVLLKATKFLSTFPLEANREYPLHGETKGPIGMYPFVPSDGDLIIVDSFESPVPALVVSVVGHATSKSGSIEIAVQKGRLARHSDWTPGDLVGEHHQIYSYSFHGGLGFSQLDMSGPCEFIV